MNKQELILLRFRESVTNHKSFTQHLADTLSISYDAAYRRIQGKAKLEIAEAMTLSRVAQFSLDDISLSNRHNAALGKTTLRVNSLETFHKYLKEMEIDLREAGKQEVQWVYSAKDIPVFHHFGNQLLAKFKVYVWMQLLDKDSKFQRFADFHLPLEISQQMIVNKKLFENLSRIEIWNDTTISSSLQQISFYYKAGCLSLDTALLLCKDLKSIITKAEEQLGESYNIYYHELLLMTNNSMVYKNEVPVTVFITMSMLEYIKFTGNPMVQRVHEFLQHQLKQATALSDASVKDRALFFNKMYQKINALEEYLERFQFLTLNEF